MDLSSTIHYLGERLGHVISELESPALFETEETIRALAKARRAGDDTAAVHLANQVAALSPDSARAVASAFALYFDLANIAEEAQRVHALREREREQYPAPIADSIAEAIAFLRFDGVPANQVAELLSELRIELVLTAHPTEAKRRTVLSKLAGISEIVRALYNSDLLPLEREAYARAVEAEIEGLWLTNRARTQRPDLLEQLRQGRLLGDVRELIGVDAQADVVAVFERAGADALTVDECPVAAARILDAISLSVLDDLGVLSGDSAVGEIQVVVLHPPEREWGVHDFDFTLIPRSIAD